MHKKIKPKKHLGQHFLINTIIAEQIIDLLDVNDSTLIEVGPGRGILTDILVAKNYKKLIIIDIDKEAIDFLVNKYDKKNIKILHGDFLDFPLDIKKNNEKSTKIIGNFPYNITSQIFFHVLEYKENAKEIVCMVQKEVAERLSAPPGTRKCGILTILLQLWYEISLKFYVGNENFDPPPKVESAVIKLVRNDRETLPVNAEYFKKVVKQAFNKRRKTIRNALKSLGLPIEITKNQVFDKRAESITIEEYIEITKQATPYL